MRRMLVPAAVSLFVMGIAFEAVACGDKLLVVGRGARFQRGYVAIYPASVLLVDTERTAANGLLVSLRRAGHRVDVVQDSNHVRGAVTDKKYEVVLSDWSNASEIEPVVSSAAPSALFLPMLDDTSPADVAAARKVYRCTLQPDKKKGNRNFLAGLDEAIESKRKAKPLECDLK